MSQGYILIHSCLNPRVFLLVETVLAAFLGTGLDESISTDIDISPDVEGVGSGCSINIFE